MFYYKNYGIITWAYCKYMWEAHPNLPIVDIETIKDVFQQVN